MTTLASHPYHENCAVDALNKCMEYFDAPLRLSLLNQQISAKQYYLYAKSEGIMTSICAPLLTKCFINFFNPRIHFCSNEYLIKLFENKSFTMSAITIFGTAHSMYGISEDWTHTIIYMKKNDGYIIYDPYMAFSKIDHHPPIACRSYDDLPLSGGETIIFSYRTP